MHSIRANIRAIFFGFISNTSRCTCQPAPFAYFLADQNNNRQELALRAPLRVYYSHKELSTESDGKQLRSLSYTMTPLTPCSLIYHHHQPPLVQWNMVPSGSFVFYWAIFIADEVLYIYSIRVEKTVYTPCHPSSLPPFLPLLPCSSPLLLPFCQFQSCPIAHISCLLPLIHPSSYPFLENPARTPSFLPWQRAPLLGVHPLVKIILILSTTRDDHFRCNKEEQYERD